MDLSGRDSNGAALAELRGSLKNSRVETSEENLFFESIDHSRYFFRPEAAIVIGDSRDVGTVLKLANKYGVCVSVRGRGTGCSGGALPQKGGWVLDLSGLSKISINASTWVAEVGAGAITADIDKAAGEYGLFYPPDPSSHLYCSIGGHIACNAGGLRAAKYGVTRDYVLALEGYLPNGEFVRFGRPLRKFSVGLNLRDLWIGSEGLLGVITKAFLKLARRPEKTRTYLFFPPNSKAAFRCVSAILRARVMPSILEFMDSQSCACAKKYCPEASFADGSTVLLAELDGSEAQIDSAEAEMLSAAANYAPPPEIAKTSADAQKLWAIRRKCSQSMYEIADSKLNQDIVLPSDRAEEFFDYFNSIGRDNNVATPTFGHAADGNYHIHAMYFGSNPKSAAAARFVMDKAVAKCVSLGGAVSGEHGIGILKSRYMSLQHSPAEIEAMRAVKRALDPNNILNSGKVLEPFNLDGIYPLKGVRLPWDK